LKEFIKTFFVFGLATFIDKIIAFAFLPIYAKVLTIEEFGSMELLQSIISIVSIFAFLQLETALQRYFYELGDAELKSFAASIFLFVFILSLVLCVGVSIFSTQVSHLLFEKNDYSRLVIMAIWQIPLMTFYTLSTIMLRFSKKYDVFLRLIVLSSLCNVLLLYFFLIYRHEGLNGYFQAQLISISIVSVYAFSQIRGIFDAKFSLSELKTALHYALPQFPARVGSTLNAYANRFFINAYVDAYSLGLFAMAFKISSVIQIIYQFFLMFWNQMMFEIKLKVNHKEILIDVLKVANAVMFFLVSLLAIFSKDILLIVAKNYIEGHYLIGIISLSFALVLLKEIVDIGPKYSKKTHYLSINFSISVVFNLVSLFLMAPRIGLLGVALSLVVANGSLFFISWFTSNKIYFIAFDKMNFVFNSIFCVGVIMIDVVGLLGNVFYFKLCAGICVLCYYAFLAYVPGKNLLQQNPA